MTSHLSVSVTPSQAGVAATGLTTTAKGTTTTPLGGFGNILDALHAIESVATGNIAGALAALTQSPTAGAAVTSAATGATTTLAPAAGTAPASLTEGLATAAATTASAQVSPTPANTITDGTVSVPLAATGIADPAVEASAGVDATAGTPPRLLHNLVSALADLDKTEQSGAPVDRNVLKRVKTAVDALSAFLAGQQPAAPMPVPSPTSGDAPSSTSGVGPIAAIAGAANAVVASLTGPASPATASAVATVAPGASTTPPDPATTDPASAQETDDSKSTAAARVTLGKLADKIEALSSTVAKDQPDLAAKLDTLAKALDPKALATSIVTQLGLGTTGPAPDPKLATAINGLINGKIEAPAASEPALATPQLQLPTGTSLGAAPAPKGKSTGIQHVAKTRAPEAASRATRSASDSKSDAAASKPGDDAKSSTATTPTTSATASTPDRPALPGVAAATSPSPDGSVAASAAAAAATTTPASASPQADLRQAQNAYQTGAPAAVNLPQMAFEIVRHSQQGTNHFQIRLDPADMGRVDVKLAVDSSGSVNARLTVERPETLDLLKRDAGALGQALTQAGLDGSKTNLQFSLSQNPFARQDPNPGSGSYTPPAPSDDAASLDTVGAIAATSVYRGTAAPSGLNIFV